ncbi:hypothetical protein WN943_004901 [Citrus x changshan-huyou]
MILYDALFIIELFLRHFEFLMDSSNAAPYNAPLRLDIWLDLAISISNDKHIFLGHVDVQFKHFTDLKRYLTTKRFSRPQNGRSTLDIPCAVKLQESGELQIPAIKKYDMTEPLLRNLMALEQCHYPFQTYICNYIYLMDSLINAEEDVNLLVEAGII